MNSRPWLRHWPRSTVPLRLHSIVTLLVSVASGRSRSSNSSTASGIRAACGTRGFCARIAGGEPVTLRPARLSDLRDSAAAPRVAQLPVTRRGSWLTLHLWKALVPGGAAGLQTRYGGVSRFLVGSTPAAFRQNSQGALHDFLPHPHSSPDFPLPRWWLRMQDRAGRARRSSRPLTVCWRVQSVTRRY